MACSASPNIVAKKKSCFNIIRGANSILFGMSLADAARVAQEYDALATNQAVFDSLKGDQTEHYIETSFDQPRPHKELSQGYSESLATIQNKDSTTIPSAYIEEFVRRY